MRNLDRFALFAVALSLAAGCRTATRVIEEPRVDFDVPTGGNRGYLVGMPPPVSEDRKPTRTMVETEFELPAGANTSSAPQPLDAAAIASSSGTSWDTSSDESYSAQPAARYDSYAVQRGDTLWSIAAKREIYNDATKWRRIYEANKDILKSPDKIKAGMNLRIPRDGGESVSEKSSSTASESVTYSK